MRSPSGRGLRSPAPLVPAHGGHAGPLAMLHGLAFAGSERWDAAAFARLLELPTTIGLIAGGDGFVLAAIAADEAEILTLAVAPAARRRGVGGRLLAGICAACLTRGARRMTLEVAAGNAAALSLYRAAGFVEVGRRPRYYANSEDALILASSLPCAAAAARPRPGPD